MDKRKQYVGLRSSFDAQLPKACGNCAKSDGELHIHHVVPLSLGGNNVISNLIRLCNECHALVHGGHNFVKSSADNLIKAIKDGKARPGSVPYGYKIENKRYEIDGETAEVVRYIFRLRYYYEYSTTNIAVILNNFAIPAPRGTLWSHATVLKALENPVYSGEAVYKGENYGELYPAIVDEEMTQRIAYFNAKYRGKRLKARKVPQLY